MSYHVVIDARDSRQRFYKHTSDGRPIFTSWRGEAACFPKAIAEQVARHITALTKEQARVWGEGER